MILPLLLALAVLVIVIAGASWRRHGRARPPHHISIIVLAMLILLAGLGVIFGSRGW
jgi:hypothetical protein